MVDIYWFWWIAALVLVFLEMVIPGTFFLWSAVAAVLVGFFVVFMPDLHIAYQLFAFSSLSLITLVFSRTWLKNHPIQSEQPYLNQRGTEFIGKTYSLIEPIENGAGYIKAGGSHWRVEGPDAAEGTQVRVIGIEGTKLRVEPLS